VVGADHLDLLALDGAAEILSRHLCGGERALAGSVGIDARHVGEDADLHDVIGDLRLRRAARACNGAHSKKSGDRALH
jgi:hypothetical protein